MTAEELIERFAQNQDQLELEARRCGAFESAVCHQQFAAWYRDCTFCLPIHGVEAVSLFAEWSNGMSQLDGDACRDPVALRAIAEHATALANSLEREATEAFIAMVHAVTAQMRGILGG